jgi:hypothetical protein
MSNGAEETNSGKSSCVAVPEVLRSVSHEVRLLTDGVSDLQDLVGNLIVAGAFGGSNSLYELQSLDRICQNLDAIADYLAGISRLSSPDWKIDVTEASRAVKIAELGGRLSGVGEAGEPVDNRGEFEDFEGYSLAG